MEDRLFVFILFCFYLFFFDSLGANNHSRKYDTAIKIAWAMMAKFSSSLREL